MLPVPKFCFVKHGLAASSCPFNCFHSVQVSQVLSSHDSDPICTEQNGDSNPICTEQNGGPTKIVDPQVTHIPRQRF
jgi:hypothetical protein